MEHAYTAALRGLALLLNDSTTSGRYRPLRPICCTGLGLVGGLGFLGLAQIGHAAKLAPVGQDLLVVQSASGDVGHGSGLLCFGLGQLGPDQAPVVGPEVLARDPPLGGPLQSRGQLCGAGADPVCDVVEMPERDCTGCGYLLTLMGIKRSKEGFQVHAPLHQTMFFLSTSFDVLGLLEWAYGEDQNV